MWTTLVAGVVGIGEVWEVTVVIVCVLTVCEGGGHRWPESSCDLGALLTLGAHARGLQYLSCLSVCVCVCVFSLFWHLAQSGVQTAVSATSARYGHEI